MKGKKTGSLILMSVALVFLSGAGGVAAPTRV
jgi:hypothetical protein